MKMLPYEEINGTAIIRTRGAFTAKTLPRLEYTVRSLVNRAPELIALDCAMISDIDAAAIAFLLRSSNHLKKHDITFAICNLNRDMKRKFDILSIPRCLTIISDRAIHDHGIVPLAAQVDRR